MNSFTERFVGIMLPNVVVMATTGGNEVEILSIANERDNNAGGFVITSCQESFFCPVCMYLKFSDEDPLGLGLFLYTYCYIMNHICGK